MARDNELQVFFTLNDKAFKKGVKQSKKELGGFGKAVSGLGLALGAREMLNFGIQASRTAGKVKAVRLAFDKLNGVSLKQLREATKGTISDLELMQRVNLAQKLGLDASKLGSLFQFAARTAQETGQSIDYLVDSIVTGIGRKSPRILDNLGISAIALKKELGGVAAETATVADITAAVGRIAEKSMGKTSGIVDTTEVSVSQLRSSWDNFIASFGEKSAPAFNTVVQGLSKLIDKVNELYKTTQDLAGETGVGQAGDIITGIFGSTDDADKRAQLLEAQIAKYSKLKEEQAKLFVSQSNSKGRGRKLMEFMGISKNEVEAIGNKTFEYTAILSKLEDAYKNLKSQIKPVSELTDEQQKIYTKYNKQLALINADTVLFGKNTANLGAKIEFTKDAMASLVSEGIDPQSTAIRKLRGELQGYEGDLKGFISSRTSDIQLGRGGENQRAGLIKADPSKLESDAQARIQEAISTGNALKLVVSYMSEAQAKTIEWRNTLESVGITWQNVGAQIGQVFGQMLTSGNMAFGDLLKMLGRLVAKFILAVAAAAALRSITGSPGAAGQAIGAASGVVSGLSGLIGGLIPMAKGGILTGPTPILAGEAGNEAIIPLSKAPDIFAKTMDKTGGAAGGGGFKVENVIRGQDLLTIIERAQGFRGRRGG